MEPVNSRVLFAKTLREVLQGNQTKEILGTTFMDRLSRVDPDLYYPSRISDQSLNAAWNFADYYFDALAHGSEDCEGIPLDKATEKLNQMISVLERGGEIKDPDVLRLYYKPKEWKFQKRFPWISRS